MRLFAAKTFHEMHINRCTALKGEQQQFTAVITSCPNHHSNAPVSVTTLEFFLNLFTEFIEFNDKNICHYTKGAQTSHLLY